jgi:hypothetical protein
MIAAGSQHHARAACRRRRPTSGGGRRSNGPDDRRPRGHGSPHPTPRDDRHHQRDLDRARREAMSTSAAVDGVGISTAARPAGTLAVPAVANAKIRWIHCPRLLLRCISKSPLHSQAELPPRLLLIGWANVRSRHGQGEYGKPRQGSFVGARQHVSSTGTAGRPPPFLEEAPSGWTVRGGAPRSGRGRPSDQSPMPNRRRSSSAPSVFTGFP